MVERIFEDRIVDIKVSSISPNDPDMPILGFLHRCEFYGLVRWLYYRGIKI